MATTVFRRAKIYRTGSRVDNGYNQAQAQGSGSSMAAGNYGGKQPNFTPSSGAGQAVDISNGRVWLYYSGKWN